MTVGDRMTRDDSTFLAFYNLIDQTSASLVITAIISDFLNIDTLFQILQIALHKL